jgi:outer membrane protein TolC
LFRAWLVVLILCLGSFLSPQVRAKASSDAEKQVTALTKSQKQTLKQESVKPSFTPDKLTPVRLELRPLNGTNPAAVVYQSALQQLWPSALFSNQGSAPLALMTPETQALEKQEPLKTPPLRLVDVLAQVLLAHPELDAADFKRLQAQAKLLSTQGAFDVTLKNATDWNLFNSSSGIGKAKDVFSSITTLEKKTRYGATLGVGARLVTGDISTPFSPTGDAGEYFLSLRLPFLKDRGANATWAKEKQAETGLELADAEWQQKRLSLLEKAGQTYWKWVLNGRKLQVTQQLIALAEQRLKQVKRFAELGDLPEIDAVEAEQELARREALLVDEQEALQDSALDVALTLWPVATTPQKQSEAPTLQRLPQQWPTPDFNYPQRAEALALAYQHRPELKTIALGRTLSLIDWKVAANALLPQLDAIVQPGYEAGKNGIGAVLKAGVELVVPLQRRGAKGEQQLATLKLSELGAQERLLLGRLQTEVDQAFIGLRQAKLRIEKNKQQLTLAQRLEQGEQRRYELGDSTLFVLNTRERVTAEAAKQLLQAETSLQQAWLTYWIATAQL